MDNELDQLLIDANLKIKMLEEDIVELVCRLLDSRDPKHMYCLRKWPVHTIAFRLNDETSVLEVSRGDREESVRIKLSGYSGLPYSTTHDYPWLHESFEKALDYLIDEENRVIREERNRMSLSRLEGEAARIKAVKDGINSLVEQLLPKG